MTRAPLAALFQQLLAAQPRDDERALGSFALAHAARTAGADPFDRACLGGAHAHSLGQAFVAGYRAALERLAPGGPPSAALCVTEADGAHPRAIQCALVADARGALALTGQKRWVSLGPRADALLVAARVGEQPDGRPSIALVRVPADRAGVHVEPMPPTPFVPDVPHASVRFDAVRVEPDEVLPGDGYARYIKPFRTIEDGHVFAGALGYLCQTAARAGWPASTIAGLFAAIAALRALSDADPSAPGTHLALEGALREARARVDALEPLWSSAPADRREGWARDRALLRVAQRARDARFAAAVAALGLSPPDADKPADA
jgi:alkylation response protein AidB-like acyl-CoA dehydrogenase